MNKKKFSKKALAVATAPVTTAAVLSLGTDRTVNADTFSLETDRTINTDTFSLEIDRTINADTFSLETGTTVNADTFSLGDVNLDGKVDLKDAQLTLKCSLRISSLDGMQFTGADVNLDDKVDLIDAQKILKGALHIEKIEGKNHTHTLKEHTATKQVWVSNIVTVDDYEETGKVVYNGYLECDCGKRFDYDEIEALEEHVKTSAFEQLRNNGTWTTCGSYMIYEWPEIEKVKVGSHQEDHGHYENQTYVDYYY